MQLSTSFGRKSFRRGIAFAAVLAFLGAVGAALTFGAGPRIAAEFAAQPDTQIAVFMVPVTILIAAMMFEVGKFVWRGRIPAETKPSRRLHWSAESGRR
jgi:hypothetical protein